MFFSDRLQVPTTLSEILGPKMHAIPFKSRLHPKLLLTNSERTQYPNSVKATKKNPSAVALGRMGGRAIAERGPEYFRRLQAKRKTHAGGRPPAKKSHHSKA